MWLDKSVAGILSDLSLCDNSGILSDLSLCDNDCLRVDLLETLSEVDQIADDCRIS